MSKKRILSHQLSRQLSVEDLEGVAAAGMTQIATGNGSYQPGRGWDHNVDIHLDR